MQWTIFFSVLFSFSVFSTDMENTVPVYRSNSVRDLKQWASFETLCDIFSMLPDKSVKTTLILDTTWRTIKIRGKVTYIYKDRTLYYTFSPNVDDESGIATFSARYGALYPEALYIGGNIPDDMALQHGDLDFEQIQKVNDVLQGKNGYETDFSGFSF